MAVENIAQIEKELRTEQARLVDLLSRTSRHFNRDEPYSADFAEQAAETENDQVVEALDAEARIELAAIEKALKRIENGTYGTCQTCGEEIKAARLGAVPYTDSCIQCASKAA